MQVMGIQLFLIVPALPSYPIRMTMGKMQYWVSYQGIRAQNTYIFGFTHSSCMCKACTCSPGAAAHRGAHQKGSRANRTPDLLHPKQESYH